MKKKLLRLLALLGLAGLLLFLCLLAASLFVCRQSAPRILSREEALAQAPFDCILVLGCGVRPDGSPSLMLRDRLEQGLALYESGAAPKLLMSGDHGQVNYNEVGTMRRWAENRGVPSADIFEDHAGFSTYESMYRARDVFQVKRVLIVSQGYHLSRAVYDAAALGLDAWGVAAEDIAYGGQTYREAREILARAKDLIWSWFQPLPTFLGEPIPITGSGDATRG